MKKLIDLSVFVLIIILIIPALIILGIIELIEHITDEKNEVFKQL